MRARDLLTRSVLRACPAGIGGPLDEQASQERKARGARFPWARGGEGLLAWVITRLCRDCLDMSCVEVCPVDCIYEYRGEDRDGFPNQLFIDPEECIDCGVCEPECPWEAIFQDGEVPDVFQEDIDANARITRAADARAVPEKEDRVAPTPQQVEENRRKWGYAR